MDRKTQEALHKALKVLNCLNNDRVYETAWVKGAINACEEALASNSEALAQQSQNNLRWANAVIDAHKDGYKACKEALAQPAQEPVAWLSTNSIANEVIKSCSAPSWQGLSDDEIQSILDNSVYCEVDAEPFARAIEQALKEKNT